MLCFANFFLFAAKYAVTHFYDVIFIHMNYESHSFKQIVLKSILIRWYICYMLYDFNEKWKDQKKKKNRKKNKDKVVFFFYTECLNHFTVHLINTNVLISSYWAFLIFFKFHDIWNISFLFFWFYAVVLLTLSDLTLKV